MISLQRRALKIYEFRRIFKLPNSEEREEMIKTELRLLSKLNHPNLIKYVDVFTNKEECRLTVPAICKHFLAKLPQPLKLKPLKLL